jgi:prolipoprotein diacylglyceryl transferase
MSRPYGGYRWGVQPVAYLPSPSQSVWHLGPIPIRAYALCIVAGIFVALWLAARRMRERGGKSEDVWDVAGWAIVFGIIGGRLYHVLSDPELYFEGKPGTSPIDAVKIWDGGLGIWGAIALGTLGAWIGCRRKKISLVVFADAAAPGVLFAQAIGRWGNWFNNELYGGPTSLPWGLQVHCLDVSVGHAVAGGTASGGERCVAGATVLAQHYQPTFLYESLWDLAIAFLLLYLDRRLRLGRGNVMALYVMGYTAGRVWIEALRTDHANHILGLRLNIWTSVIVFALALLWFVRHGAFHAERETTPYTGDRAEAETEAETKAETKAETEKERSEEIPPEDDREEDPVDVRSDE